jgi:hypothetical protein
MAMEILIGSEVASVLLALGWNKTNRTAAMFRSHICGVTIWLLSANTLYGNVSLMSTGQNIPHLVGNLISISIDAIVTVTGSIIRPERFNFGITRQKIHVVDEKIRSMIMQDGDQAYLAKIPRYGYRYAIVISLILVVAWPLRLYFSGYIFSYLMYQMWIVTALMWTSVKLHYERIVKIGYPSGRIANTAEKLDVDVVLVIVRDWATLTLFWDMLLRS